MNKEQKTWTLIILCGVLTPFLGYLVVDFRDKSRALKNDIRELQTLWDEVSALNEEVVAEARRSGGTVTKSPIHDTYVSWID